MKTTFTVRQYDKSSYWINEAGKAIYGERWNCGHKHRSLIQASKCLKKLDGYTRSIGAGIYDQEGAMIEPDEAIYYGRP